MFVNFWKAAKRELISVKSHQISSLHIEALLNSINKNRWGIFTCLVEKEPNNLTELSQLLDKDYGNVWQDCEILEGMGIIELKKIGSGIKPIALYDRIVFDLSVKKVEQTYKPRIPLSLLH
ncbi:MAG: hypothetical protein MRERC_3c080 [Mycoplasmataceae bacterium RC_NB112A]|nr:MAG: hypothetical protein MRERC_3c080 [Mycoplasmataceae bacterium RC_NB112A]